MNLFNFARKKRLLLKMTLLQSLLIRIKVNSRNYGNIKSTGLVYHEEVFEAFVNPEITSKFWFTKGSSRLEIGKQIRWDWEMFNHSVEVKVKAIEENKRIIMEW